MLRRQSSDAEIRLWAALRNRQLGGYRFRRQHPIGPFIADFACVEHRLVVEADGGQHNGSAADDRRTDWLADRGWRVLRFWNNDILANTAGVLEAILEALPVSPLTRLAAARHPLPPSREREDPGPSGT
jgi:very-short-patch-repair endonuclease